MNANDFWIVVALGLGFGLLTFAGLWLDRRDGRAVVQQVQAMQRLKQAGPHGYGRSWSLRKGK